MSRDAAASGRTPMVVSSVRLASTMDAKTATKETLATRLITGAAELAKLGASARTNSPKASGRIMERTRGMAIAIAETSARGMATGTTRERKTTVQGTRMARREAAKATSPR